MPDQCSLIHQRAATRLPGKTSACYHLAPQPKGMAVSSTDPYRPEDYESTDLEERPYGYPLSDADFRSGRRTFAFFVLPDYTTRRPRWFFRWKLMQKLHSYFITPADTTRGGMFAKSLCLVAAGLIIGYFITAIRVEAAALTASPIPMNTVMRAAPPPAQTHRVVTVCNYSYQPGMDGYFVFEDSGQDIFIPAAMLGGHKVVTLDKLQLDEVSGNLTGASYVPNPTQDPGNCGAFHGGPTG